MKINLIAFGKNEDIAKELLEFISCLNRSTEDFDSNDEWFNLEFTVRQ